ncbi:MAG: hypothetical protein RLY86_1472 [Pseudomonadota bacterium]|jgi:multicomponent Na+:H+ antiporter subunit A
MVSALSVSLWPLVAAALAPLVGRLAGRHTALVAALLSGGLFVLLLFWLGPVAEGPVLQSTAWVPSLGIDLAFRLDGFSLLFALLITGIGTLVLVYSGAYMAGDPDLPRFLAYILGFMGAMLGLVLADNLILLFIFWELTSFFSFLLIGFNAESKKARDAAVQSLIITVGGGLALFAGLLMLGIAAGSFSLTAILADPAPVLASPLFPAIVACILAGCFTKSAQFPVHFWLPNAMQAPTPASAFLHSATMVKAGIYLLLRLDPAFGSQAIWIWPLVVVGSLTMVAAAVQALRHTEFKAILAYTTVAALGTLVMLAGLDHPTAGVAAIGFILAHAFYKASLFFVAGTTIRSVGSKDITRMGGLAPYLPVTAVAAVMACLSMAGLPPFGGFIAKELVFEAKLADGWLIIALSVGVLVNAAIIAIAFVTALRPFFLKPPAPLTDIKGESPGLYAGPIVLAALGAVMGLAPELFNASILAPAAGAISAEPVTGYFKLWHGLTPMLAMSALAIGIGLCLAWKWEPIHRHLAAVKRLDLLSPQGLYSRSLAWVLAVGGRLTARLQDGRLRVYALVVFIVSAGALALGLIAAGGPVLPDLTVANRPYAWIFAGLMVAGALAAAGSRNLMASLLAIGLVGYAVAVLFLKNGAPDLAFTQFAVETLFVVIVMAVLLKLPLDTPDPRSGRERALDAAVAAAVGGVTTLVALSALALPFNGSISDFFRAVSLAEANGRNVVNVILVDFRALDTLGEIAVVAFAAFAAWGLLRGRRIKEG